MSQEASGRAVLEARTSIHRAITALSVALAEFEESHDSGSICCDCIRESIGTLATVQQELQLVAPIHNPIAYLLNK